MPHILQIYTNPFDKGIKRNFKTIFNEKLSRTNFTHVANYTTYDLGSSGINNQQIDENILNALNSKSDKEDGFTKFSRKFEFNNSNPFLHRNHHKVSIEEIDSGLNESIVQRGTEIQINNKNTDNNSCFNSYVNKASNWQYGNGGINDNESKDNYYLENSKTNEKISFNLNINNSVSANLRMITQEKNKNNNFKLNNNPLENPGSSGGFKRVYSKPLSVGISTNNDNANRTKTQTPDISNINITNENNLEKEICSKEF